MHKGNPRASCEAKAEQSATEHTLGSVVMTKVIGLALASKCHDFGWRLTRRPGTQTGPYQKIWRNQNLMGISQKHVFWMFLGRLNLNLKSDCP